MMSSSRHLAMKAVGMALQPELQQTVRRIAIAAGASIHSEEVASLFSPARGALPTASRRQATAVITPVAAPRSWFCSSVAPEELEEEDDLYHNHRNDKLCYFDVLGLPRQFLVNQNDLKNQYRKLMTHYHPDKHHDKTPAEQAVLEQQASAVTQAYNTLKQPHLRAMHMLDILGDNPVDEHSTGALVGNEFLMEIMSVREMIEEAEPEELNLIMRQNQRRIDETCEQLAVALRQHDLQPAAQLAAQLQYWNRVDETLREKMEVQS